MASSSRGDWKKKLQHSLGVSVRVYGCVCVWVCWPTMLVTTHTHTPHTHSCTHPGQQVAPQPLTRTNIWQLPHPASSCRMLPAACCLLLLLFCHFCSSCSGPCCRRGRINVEPLPVPVLLLFYWARRVQRLSRKKGQQSEKTKRKQKSNRKKSAKEKFKLCRQATKVK